ncbi:DUF3800 domain-containing protein [Paraburkholderia sp. A1RI-2L]|uniref:DUF3800 domain-containing protein n=1 Tax=Paraburkholderia sp. A1RI-2L TaxID=3028367 RepID=UPI003B9EDCE3
MRLALRHRRLEPRSSSRSTWGRCDERHRWRLRTSVGGSATVNHDSGRARVADYHFTESASLEFTHSHESLGIQMVDVIAGATMRYYRSLYVDPASIAPGIARAMEALRNAGDPETGQGLNQVVPTRMAL